MSFVALQAPDNRAVQHSPSGAFWAFAAILLPLLNMPLVAASAALGEGAGVVALAVFEVAGIGWYLHLRGFGAAWTVFAGLLSLAISFLVLFAAFVLWASYGCGGDGCLS